MKTPRLFALAAILCALPLAAGENNSVAAPRAPLPHENAAPEPAFVIECQMVTIPGKLLPTLVPDLNDETKAAAAFAKLQAMILSGDATLSGYLSAHGVWNRAVTAESVEEVRYASEFEPPQLPSPGAVEPSLEALKNWPMVGIVPMSFETRRTGQSMTIDAGRTSDRKVLVCSYTVEHVRLEKFVKFDAGRLANGERLNVEQPYFSSMKDQSQVTLLSGQPKLIGVHRLPGPEAVFELFVLTLRVNAKAP